jgi:ribosomal protein L7/L12
MAFTLRDVALLLSLATNALLIWFIARRAAAGPPAPARPLSDGDLERVRDELRGGNKIQAIKLYRQISGCGLKDAKDSVEAMQ